MKKEIIRSIIVIIVLGLAFISFYPKWQQSQNNVTPKNNPSEEILDYAFLALKQRDLYSDIHTENLKSLGDAYESIGQKKKASKIKRLVEQIRKRRLPGEKSYQPEYLGYKKEWTDVEAELKTGDIREALELSKDKPYALIKLSEYFAEKGDRSRALELLDQSNWSWDKYVGTIENQYIQQEMALGYFRLGAYSKADLALSETKIFSVRELDQTLVKMVQLLDGKNNPELAFHLFERMQHPESKITGLIASALVVNGTEFRLDEPKRKEMQNVVEQNKALQVAWNAEIKKDVARRAWERSLIQVKKPEQPDDVSVNQTTEAVIPEAK